MNATVKAAPVWIGYDPGKEAGSAAIFAFVCTDCDRTELRPIEAIPKGWDLSPRDCSGVACLRCPDCNEAIQQTKFTEMRNRLCDALEAIGASTIGIHPPEPRKPASPNPFAIWLERNEGKYLVALTPETALMRLSPLGFFLSPEGARATAWELLKYADLAEAPGTLPASMGDDK